MSQVFTKIGFEIDSMISGIANFIKSDAPQKDTKPKRQMRGRITDEEALEIIKSNYKPVRHQQMKVFHDIGYGISNERMTKLHEIVRKEALASNMESTINEKQL